MDYKFNNTVDVTTTLLDYQTIESKISDMSGQVSVMTIELQEKQVRNTLKSLGYLPPELTAKLVRYLESLRLDDNYFDRGAERLLDEIRG